MGKGKGRSKGKNGTPQRSVVRTRESHNVSNSSHEQSILTTSDSKVVQKFVSQSSTRTTCETSEEHTHNGFSTGAFGGNAGSEFDISLNNNKKAAATTGHSLIPELDPRFKVTKEHREYYNTGPQEYYDGNTHIKYHESGNNFYREAHYDSRDNQNQPTDQDIHVEERRSSNKSNDLREVFDQRGQNHEGASKRRSGVYEVPIERKNVGSHLSLNIPYQPDNEINIPLNNKKFSSHRDIPILFEERRHSDEQASNAHEERKLSRHPSNGSSIHMTQAVPDAYKTVYVSSSNIHNDRSRAQSQNRLQAGDDNHQHHRSRSVSVPRNRLDGGAYDVSNRDEIVHSNSHNYEKSTIEQSRNERILSGAPSIKNQQEQDPRSRTNSVRSHISEKEFGFGDVIDEPLSRQASRRSNRRYDAKDQISQDEFLLIGGCPPSSNTIHSRISYTEPSDGNIRSNQDEWRASQTSLHGHGDGGRSSEYYQQPSLTTRTLSAQSLHDGERVLSGLLGADGDYTKTLGSQSNLLDRHGEPQTPSGTDVRQRSRSLNRYGETVEIPFNNLAHGPHSRATSKCSVFQTTMNTDDRLLLASQHRSRLEDDIGPVPKRRSRSTMNLGSDQITENTIRSHHSHSAHSKTDNEDRVIFSDIPTLHGHPDDVFGDDDEPGVPFRPTKEHAFTPNNRPSTKPPVRPHSDTVNTYGADVEIPLNQVRRTVSNQSLDAPPAPLAYSSVLTPVGKHFSDYDVSVQDTPNTVINEPRCVKTIFQPLTTEIAIQTGDTIRVRNENGSAQPTVVKNTINANKPKMNSSFERNGHPAANVLTNMLQTRRKDEVTETTHHEHRHRVSKRYSENDHHTHVDENFNIKPKGVPSNAPRVIPPQSSFKPAATSSPTRLSDQGPTPSRLQPRPDRRQRSPASSIGSRNEVFFSKLNSPTKSEYDDDEELIRKIADAKWTGNKNSGDTLRLHVKPGKIKDLASAFDNLQTESKKQEHVLDQKTRSKSANRWIQPSEQPKRGSQGSEPVRRNDVDERISNQKRVEKSRRSEEIRREIEEQRILEERNALTRQREEEERIWRLNEQRRQEAEDREAKAREEEERIWRLNEQRRQEAEDREAKTREEEERIWRLDEQRRQEAEDREAKTREELSNIEKIRREIEAQREIDERNRILRQREVDVNAWTTREHRVNERNSHYQKTEESSNVDKIRREIDEQRAIDERERIQRQRDDEERAWRLQEQKRQFDERNTIFQKSEETSNVQKIKKEIEKQRVVDEQNTRYRQDRGSDNRDEYRQHRPQQKKYGQNFPHETVQRRVEETRRNEEIRNERVERRQIPDQNHARGDHYDNSGHLSQNSSTTSSRGALDAVPNSRESLYQPKTPTTPQLKDFTNFDDFAARPCSKPYAERPEEPLGGGDKYGSLTKIQHGAVRSLRDNFETKTSSHTKQRESVRRTRSEVPTDQRLLYSVPKPYTRPDGSISNASQASSTYKHVTPARSYSLRRDPITVPINRKAPFGTESNQPVVRNVQDVRTTSNNNYENISNYTTHHNQTTNKHSRYETPVYANQEAFKSVPREVPVDARFPEPAWNGQNTVPVDNVHQSSTHKIHNTVHRENVDHHTHHHHQSTRPSHVNPNSYVHVDTKTPITKQPRANIPPAEQVSRSNKDRLWEEKVRRREEEERMEEERRKTERQYAFENVQQIDDFHPTGKRPNMPVGTGYTTDDACSRITHPSFAGHKTDEESSIRGKIDKMFAFVEHDESRKSTIEVPVDVHFGKPQHPEFKTFEVPIDRTPRKEATEWKTQPGSGWKTNEMCRNSVPGANEHYEHVEHRYLTRTVHETENVAYSLKDYRDIQRAVGRHDQHLLQEEPQFYRSPAAASHAGQSLHTYHAKDIVGTPAIGEKLLTNVREVPIALATSTPNESPQSHRGAVGCTFNCSDTFVSSISGLSMVEVQADYRKKIHKLQYMIETSTKQMTLNELALVDAQKNNKIHHEISAHRALLISRETVRLQRDELRRLHALSAVRRPPPPVSRELKSTATFSNITLHLNKNFCQRHNDNGSYAFMVLLKSGHRVEATEFVPLFNDSNSEYQTMVHFGQTIRFADLPVDFAVHLEAFAMRIPNPRHVEPAPSSLKEKCKSLMGPPQKKVAPQPVEHLFRMRGRITLDRDAVGHRRFYLDEISYPLEGTIDINTECSQLPEAIDMDYRGFMAIYQTVGNVASWERYWAVLRRGVVFFWKYPDDENTQKCPLMQMDLTKCTNQSIEQCPPEICPRPYSFYIEMLVNAQSTVIEKKRVLLSSDTPEMLNSWLLALNETLSVIRG